MKILTYPNPGLRQAPIQVTKEIRESQEFKDNLGNFIEIAKQDGIGLAAPQVGWNFSVFASLVSRDMETLPEPQIFINPKIIYESSFNVEASEGCISFPGLSLHVKRAEEIEWEWEDLNGVKSKTKERYLNNKKGYYIRLIQHETDHLHQILFCDRIGPSQVKVFKDWLARINNEKSTN